MPVKTIQSVENALVVIEALAREQPVGVSALARTVDLDKNAVQRILLTLGQSGWIRQLEGGEWTITSKALQIGTHFTAGLREAAHPHLVALQARTKETVLLFAHEGANMVVLDTVDSTQALRMTVPVGTVVPLRASAAFDAFLSDTARAKLPPVRPAPSAAALAKVRHDGWFVIDGLYPNAIAGGAPVTNARGTPVASITVVGPKVRVTKVDARALGQMAAETARLISGATLG
ncbi:MAG TPA: IclR family transcriptional regulator [Ilumatobacteraceae bacterium]